MTEIAKYEHCFVCGDKNDNGLQAVFRFDGEWARTKLVAQEKFEGYRGVYHGGILSTLLDEVMIKAILARSVVAVTAELTVKFLHPVAIGETLDFAGRIISNRRRLYETEGLVTNGTGQTIATARGKYIEAPGELRSKLKQSID